MSNIRYRSYQRLLMNPTDAKPKPKKKGAKK